MKCGKKEIIIGGVAAAAVVAAGVGFFAFKAKDPKTVVVDAFKGVYAAENVNPVEEVFGLKQLYQQFETTGGEMGLEVSIADFYLGGGYGITKEPIDKAEVEAKIAAYKEVFPEASDFVEDGMAEKIAASAEDLMGQGFGNVYIDSAAQAVDASGAAVGYVVSSTSKDGFGGEVKLSVGINGEGKVTGIAFLSLAETPGLGMNATGDEFKGQFAGKNAEALAVTKTGFPAENEIQAMSGATITSEAVTNAVNVAIYFVNNCTDNKEEDLDMFQGAGITVEAATDIANKRFFENIGISYGGMDIANLHFYGDDTYLMVAMPEFTSKVLTVNYAEDLSEQIANSPLMEGTGTVLTEEDREIIDNYISYVTGIYTGEKKPFDLEASWQRYKEGSQAMADFKEAMTVTKTDGAQLMYNGKQQSCNGYHVVIPKEALIGFLKTTYQFFMEDQALKQDFLEYIKVVMDMGNMPYPEAVGEGALTSEEMLANLWTELNTRLDEVFAKLEQILDSGINMEVYVTKKGQLAAMDAAWSFRNEEDVLEMSLKAALEGGSYPIQNSSLTFTAVDSVDTAVVQLHKNGEYTDAVLNSGWTLNAEYSGAVMELTYENAYDRATGDSAVKLLVKDGADVNLEIAMTGVVDELEKGKKLHYIVDSLDVIDNGVTGVSFAGEFYLRELQTEFAAPEGEQMDVLAASLEDWEALLEEVMMNLYSMLMGGSLS